jgi:hypothetical protein
MKCKQWSLTCQANSGKAQLYYQPYRNDKPVSAFGFLREFELPLTGNSVGGPQMRRNFNLVIEKMPGQILVERNIIPLMHLQEALDQQKKHKGEYKSRNRREK